MMLLGHRMMVLIVSWLEMIGIRQEMILDDDSLGLMQLHDCKQ
jgi:hypothetical protein